VRRLVRTAFVRVCCECDMYLAVYLSLLTTLSVWGGAPAVFLRRFRLVAKSLTWKARQKLPKTLSRSARHYLLKKGDIEHPLFKRSVHTQGPPACAASFPGP